MCWILWHTAVNWFSCMTYCEQYCDFLLLHLIISRKMCNVFWIWNQVNLRRTMQIIISVLSGIEKIQFIFSCGKFLLNILLSKCFMTSYIFLSVPSHFMSFCALLKTFLAITSPSVVTNITNTHCHSQHSPLLPFFQHTFSYIICSKSEHFH